MIVKMSPRERDRKRECSAFCSSISSLCTTQWKRETISIHVIKWPGDVPKSVVLLKCTSHTSL